MKKTIMNIRTMAALLIASAAFTACSNEDGAVIGEQPAATQTPQVYTLTLQAANATGAQHRALELDGTKLVAKWAAGDQLKVRNIDSSYELLGGTLTASNVSADGKTCTFSGTLTGTIAVGNQLALFYHATSGTQDGTLESAAAHDQAVADVTVASVEAGNITISESEASFNTTTAVLKLTLKDGSTNALNATSLTMTVDGVDIFTASPTAATYTANGGGVLYFAVPPKDIAAENIAVVKSGGYPTEALINTWMTNLNTYDVTFTATVGSDTYTATKTGYKLAAGKYYATELTMAKVKPDLLSGVFSVSNSKKVSFSKGNLQATYDGSNWTWAFAANQWDYIGNAAGNTKVTESSPYISENATVDLFGWVGASSNWTGVNKYGITSSSATNNKNGYGNVASESLKSDWGTLIGSGWRTLSMDEWTYLLATRTVNGGTGADKSYTPNQSVNGKKGMVIYPDNYTGAVYSGSDWASFEAAGCVFLPAAGWRNGTTINNINNRGYYWSTTPSNATAAKRPFFAEGLELTGDNSRAFGFSVRLVREVE